MNITKITTPSLPDSVVSFSVGGLTYLIRMQWLQRAGVWVFSISDSNNEELASSAITPNSNLLFPIRSGDLPVGDFFVYSQSDDPLTYDDIANGDCYLCFVGED